MFLSLGLCLGALCSAGFIAQQLRQAPVGWEDEGGFHPGAGERKRGIVGAAKIPRPRRFPEVSKPRRIASLPLHGTVAR